MSLPILPSAAAPTFLGRIMTLQRPCSKKNLQLHHLPSQKKYQTFLEHDSIVTWSSVLSELNPGDGRVPFSALKNAAQLPRSGSNPNAYALVHLTRACTTAGLFSNGEHLHTQILKRGFISNPFVSTALVGFYLRFGFPQDAHQLFAEIPEPSLVSWNTLISGYVHSGKFRKAMELFSQLERSDLRSDSYSFTAALSACGQLRMVQVGKSLHSKIVKHGTECTLFVSNCLIDMYGKCGYTSESTKVFERMVRKDIISWNSLLAANARNGNLEEAVSLLHRMPCPDTISYNELIHGIAMFGDMEDAVDLLSKMQNPNSSSWNSVISGYANRGRHGEAVECFRRMHSIGFRMDMFTFSSILSGISGLSGIIMGSLIHCCAFKIGLDMYVVVGSALLDVYFKSGKIEEAHRIFHSLPEKNLVTWNILISGYAHNADSRKVIELFQELKATENMEPDEITFSNVLSACWHGNVSLRIASRYFEEMIVEHGIDPLPEHCSLMIRMMGREGDVSEAEKMIVEFGFDRCGMVWKSLLGACVACGDVRVADVAARKLVELGGDDEFVYVMMSNVYAVHGKWECVGSVRKSMRERRVRKEVGSSWIEVVKK